MIYFHTSNWRRWNFNDYIFQDIDRCCVYVLCTKWPCVSISSKAAMRRAIQAKQLLANFSIWLFVEIAMIVLSFCLSFLITCLRSVFSLGENARQQSFGGLSIFRRQEWKSARTVRGSRVIRSIRRKQQWPRSICVEYVMVVGFTEPLRTSNMDRMWWENDRGGRVSKSINWRRSPVTAAREWAMVYQALAWFRHAIGIYDGRTTQTHTHGTQRSVLRSHATRQPKKSKSMGNLSFSACDLLIDWSFVE